MSARRARSRTGLDLRLALPAAAAWCAALLVVAAPSAAPAVAGAGWVAAGAAVALGLVAVVRGWAAQLAACLVAVAVVATVVAVRAPARQPPEVLELAGHGRALTVLVVAAEQMASREGAAGEGTGGEGAARDGARRARDGPVAATLVMVAPRGSAAVVASGRASGAASGDALSVSVPVLVFGAEVDDPVGIGSTLRLYARLDAAAPEDDVGFLIFADGEAELVAPPPAYLDWANGLRAGFAAAAARLPGDGGDLLPGLAIGDTSAVGEELDAAMKASALSHLTAVSGANCAIIVGLVLLLGALAGLSRRARVAAAVLVLVGFVVLVTPQSSVVRASVMAVIVLLAFGGGRPVRGLPVLSLAALLLLCADPWLSRDYGFALSVLATGGLLVLAPALTGLLARRLPRWLAVTIAVPLAAQLACQPVLLLLDPAIPLYGVVANTLAEPAAPLATVLGLLACVLLPLVPALGGLLAAVAWLPAAWIAAVAGYFAGLPGAALPWPTGPPGVALLVIVTAGALVAALARVSRRSRVASGAVALATLVGLVGAGAGIRSVQLLSRPADWQIAACDIGQGDAVLVRSAGVVALVDTGPDPEPLAACLDDLGIARIDLLVLSHFDLDHVGGTEAVLGRVDRALVGPSGEPDDDRLVADLRERGAVVERVSRGATGILGELRWEVLWPRGRLGPVEPGNDASVTLAFEPVGRCASGCLGSLFLGDLGERAQESVLAAGGIGEVEVVKVAHHGSADQSERLYARAAARVGVVSVGAGNDYGHPTAALLDDLAAAGTTAVRTDLGGLVLLAPGPEPGTVRVWTQRPTQRPAERRRSRRERSAAADAAAARMRERSAAADAAAAQAQDRSAAGGVVGGD